MLTQPDQLKSPGVFQQQAPPWGDRPSAKACLIAHGYGKLKLEIIWAIATESMPELGKLCRQLLNANAPPPLIPQRDLQYVDALA